MTETSAKPQVGGRPAGGAVTPIPHVNYTKQEERTLHLPQEARSFYCEGRFLSYLAAAQPMRNTTAQPMRNATAQPMRSHCHPELLLSPNGLSFRTAPPTAPVSLQTQLPSFVPQICLWFIIVCTSQMAILLTIPE